MGLESGTYIDSLVATNPVGSDNRNQGDDHLRLIKNTVKASFPDVDEAVVTIHNASSAPTNKQIGTFWRDTTASLWKFWNGSGWITLPFAFNTSNSVDINAGTVDGVTIGTNAVCTEARIDNITINGNAIISSDTDGDITITPNGAGEIVLDGQKWPIADGDNTDYLTTNGSGQIAWTENTIPASVTAAAGSATSAASSATTATAQAVIATAKAVLTAADVVSCNAVLDTFDDRFLGSKSSAPTLDNDGDALADGALYFLTTTNVMYVYDLATTTWLQLTPTDAEQANINVVAGNILYKEDLGSIADALSTGSGSDITTVADAIANVNTLAASAVVADMALLAESAVITDMALLAIPAVITDMDLLGATGVIADMDALGATGVIDDLETVANISANVTTVAGISGNTTTVAGVSANVTTVAGISANVTTVAGISANVTTVATNVAGVTSFAERYRVGSSNPASSLDEGDLFFNTSDNALKYYNGTSWASITAGIGSVEDDTSPTLGGALDCDNENLTNCGTISGANLQMDFGSVA